MDATVSGACCPALPGSLRYTLLTQAAPSVVIQVTSAFSVDAGTNETAPFQETCSQGRGRYVSDAQYSGRSLLGVLGDHREGKRVEEGSWAVLRGDISRTL